MTRIAVGTVLVLLVLYGAWKAWPLVSGPDILIDVPADYTTFPDGFVTLSGVAKNTESLALNDAPLLIDQAGHFQKTLLLPSGGSILTLTATDRFGRHASVRRTVYVPQTNNP